MYTYSIMFWTEFQADHIPVRQRTILATHERVDYLFDLCYNQA